MGQFVFDLSITKEISPINGINERHLTKKVYEKHKPQRMNVFNKNYVINHC